jgi:hypothetical protein
MVFLILPLAFYLENELTCSQKRIVLIIFSVAVIFSAISALLNYWLIKPEGINSIHNSGFISHIRFSFMLILAFWILVYLVKENEFKNRIQQSLYYFGILFILFFIFYQQSLTGIVAFTFSIFVFLLLQAFKLTGLKKRIVFICLGLVILAPPVYIAWVISNFYSFEKIIPEKLDHFTKQGNPYTHDFQDPMVENGNFVGLYVCDKELKEEWNKKSPVKYDSLVGEYPLKYNLIRYLTSKGLRKDAEGISSLSEKDIKNIENGLSNYIFSGRKFTLYPRLYQTIWEYYIFSKTGYVNYQSFSQRLEFMRAAGSIIKHNFLFGVGTGQWKQAFQKAYVANGSQLKPELYGSSHNQYLNYLVKFGITGLLFIIFCLIYPVIKSKKFRDPLFLIFLLFMAVANFGDSNFESHVGGAFFVFFYCIFLSGRKLNYLKKENESGRIIDSIYL